MCLCITVFILSLRLSLLESVFRLLSLLINLLSALNTIITQSIIHGMTMHTSITTLYSQYKFNLNYALQVCQHKYCHLVTGLTAKMVLLIV